MGLNYFGRFPAQYFKELICVSFNLVFTLKSIFLGKFEFNDFSDPGGGGSVTPAVPMGQLPTIGMVAAPATTGESFLG